MGSTERTAHHYRKISFVIHALVQEEMGALQRQQICSQEKSENKDAHKTCTPSPQRMERVGLTLCCEYSPSPGYSGENFEATMPEN